MRVRTAIIFLAAAMLSGCAQTSIPSSPPPSASSSGLTSTLGALEHSYSARIGFEAVDTGNGKTQSYREHERFAFASTSKVLTAALVLQRSSDAQLRRRIYFSEAELQSYSPITSRHVADGMTVDELVAAALRYSDNTAANLLFAQLGGPASVENDLRAQGDHVTNVNRIEPELNEALPGDPRDTTTAHQMVLDLRRFALDGALTPNRATRLIDLMLTNTTGGPYIRAGVPTGWKTADKTGSGEYGTRNDVAILYPPHRAPTVIAIYTGRHTPDAHSDDDLIARITAAVIAAQK